MKIFMFEDMSLEELFAAADAIGDKYLSAEEIAKRSSDIADCLAFGALANSSGRRWHFVRHGMPQSIARQMGGCRGGWPAAGNCGALG
ncbi:MAG TPA: hypothetical protein V6D09_21600 [Leptolyngbyaceae cyanobacterium]|jgi:hypothetical protein